MATRTVLISGIGIAGPALAYWLLAHGLEPTLVERAPRPRSEGYIIDFWGTGYDVAEKMGLLPELERVGHQVREVRMVDRHGQRVGGFDAEVFRRATQGRYVTLGRADLSAALYRLVEPRVESLFDNTIAALEDEPDGVVVHLEAGGTRRFDVVIGADGLHSNVRGLAFGPTPHFEAFLGYTVAAFTTSGYYPRDEDVYVAYAAPGRQVARFSLRDDRTLFLIVIAEPEPASIATRGRAAQKRYVREQLSGIGWECARILDALDRCEELYFDRVSQIRMGSWSRGRIALVGDAAFAPSLLAGQGSALAMVAAYVLAGELSRASRPQEGFARYEARLRPFIEKKQRAAARFATSFAPRTRLGVFLRNHVATAFKVPLAAKLILGSSLADDLELPDYPLA
jgi:2-polyprenyl-6-methoxyphenol hydroxylase-like FAD-dependent oxidoreductase